MVDWIMTASALAGGGAVSLGGLVARRLLKHHAFQAAPESLPETAPEMAMGIAMDRYRPMARLFNEEDLDFLASRPGYRPEMAAAMRRSQRRIFRMYLTELTADFHRLHAAARRIAVDAPAQNAEIVDSLVFQQASFWRILVGIEVRLALDWAGLGTADARGLLAVVEQLHRAVSAAQTGALAVPA